MSGGPPVFERARPHRENLIAGSWMDGAACRPRGDLNPAERAQLVEAFFPFPTDDHDPARAVCAVCPVRDECLEYALINVIDHGVWGGASVEERRRIRRRRAKARAATTAAGAGSQA